MPWSRKRLQPFSQAVETSVNLHLKGILLAIDIRGQEHIMSLSSNQSQFWYDILPLEQEASVLPWSTPRRAPGVLLRIINFLYLLLFCRSEMGVFKKIGQKHS